MTSLVLTVVGADRAGLVATVAEVVDAHGGNWERSELAELSGTFAGVIEVSVPPQRADELREALTVVDGFVTVVVPTGQAAVPSTERRLVVRVLGNDRPGIVREITAVLSGSGISIERMTTSSRDAAMAGGRLFEAAVTASVPVSTDVDAVVSRLEDLATDIQVDVQVLAAD
ncbi:ACT domain-containing protein [Microbacterium sp. NPDC089189]|uniref:glycine cleavage system protein R n=1 Tax=Microbacterium sp. NPDC089189 TaxID=3154972 RepID=UPI0034138FF0